MIENSIVYRASKDGTGGPIKFFSFGKARGGEIWDREGKRFIDFTSGWNVTNLGWNHPEISEAIIEQVEKNVQGLLWGSDVIQEEYAKALTASLPKELNACMKATGGTEAIEMSIKVARAYTGRKKILGFNEHYHGQLFASLALGASGAARERLAPLVPEITPIQFPEENLGNEVFEKFLSDLEELLAGEDIAAIVTEPGIVTGWGSTAIAYPGFLKSVRQLTAAYGTLLIIDEVGTGFSRTGKLFAIEHESVIPDMIVLAKGISNGSVAIGTSVGRRDIFEKAFPDAMLISTFGWTPLACAAALKTLQVHQRDKTWDMAEKKGAYIMKTIKKDLGGVVVAVRGKGMEIGVQFKDAETCVRVQRSALSGGLHVVVGSGDNMQLMPPLTISEEQLDEGLHILIEQIQHAP
ncbi:MAG: acetylornithine/N-succinyldiaminopimelate aminotransferase [Parcubacteria group bacterium Gr01-1014_8]|nr:MAG: acetylornithine/N-succinyldiaminopimelate aminotransferase [Parcubacteria group bacterium Gr01-1014_8]